MEAADKLHEESKLSQDVLYQAETVFPFTLFPDTIKLDRLQVSVAFRFFFRAAKVYIVPWEEIVSVEANVNIFFGRLQITRRWFTEEPVVINYLTRTDTIELQKLIQGFILAQKRKIDVSKIDKQELLMMLRELGEGIKENE